MTAVCIVAVSMLIAGYWHMGACTQVPICVAFTRVHAWCYTTLWLGLTYGLGMFLEEAQHLLASHANASVPG